MNKHTLKRGYAVSTIDLSSRKFADVGNLATTDNWWEDPPAPKETVSSAALRKFHKLRLKVQRSMSFGKSKDAGMEEKDEDGDIFYRPPKGDPFYDDMENFHPEDLSREGIQRMKEKQQRKDSISRPTKLQKLPSKEFRALREKKSRERFRNAHPLPKRPALRNMSTTPDLRDRNKRDSGFIKDLIPEFPAPPHRLRPQEHPALQELQAKRARLASASVADLSLESRIAAGRARKPSTVLWIDRPVNKPVGIPPLPPLPPGAARPRLPSQPSVSFVEHAAARARAI